MLLAGSWILPSQASTSRGNNVQSIRTGFVDKWDAGNIIWCIILFKAKELHFYQRLWTTLGFHNPVV
jgi:hypothetical protein